VHFTAVSLTWINSAIDYIRKVLIVFIYKLCLSFVLPYFQSGRSFGNYYN
jgi:hypothetical protein